MLQIRVANHDDYSRVRDFYYALIDGMKEAEYRPGWEKDIYPTQEILLQSIEDNQLYIGQIKEQIASCMVVNHAYNDGYKKIKWSIDAKDSEVFIIHLLGVHPMFSGQGLAKQMVQGVIEMAHQCNIKTIRLDVLLGNIPAEKVYTKMGFVYRDTIEMYYEDTGWTAFKLFEYIV